MANWRRWKRHFFYYHIRWNLVDEKANYRNIRTTIPNKNEITSIISAFNRINWWWRYSSLFTAWNSGKLRPFPGDIDHWRGHLEMGIFAQDPSNDITNNDSSKKISEGSKVQSGARKGCILSLILLLLVIGDVLHPLIWWCRRI